jgi:Co/Zn/Cd efflux system component
MLTLTFGYFLVELIVGHITMSVTLTADAYHMLSDVLALIIAVVAVRFSRRRSNKNTYGWVRGEVLGANVNTVFLLALSFTIIINAIQRFITPEPIQNPTLLLIVGSVGFGINIIGLFLFQGFHGHTHGGGSGHTHGGDSGHTHDAGSRHSHDGDSGHTRGGCSGHTHDGCSEHSHGGKNAHGHSHDHEEACNKPDQLTNDDEITIAVVERIANTSEFTRHSSRALEEVIILREKYYLKDSVFFCR